MDRLEFLSPSFAKRFRLATADRQRAAGFVACKLAVEAAAISEPLASDTLLRLSMGEPFTGREQAELAATAAVKDSRYLDLQDAVDRGKATEIRRNHAFAVARAWTALSLASSDSPDAIGSAIYEAAAAMGEDKTNFFTTLESALK